MTGAPPEAHVHLDAGQTGSKIRVEGEGSPAGQLVLPGVRTDVPLLPQLSGTVREVAARTGRRIVSVSAGVSGLTCADADAAWILDELHDVGVREVHLAHDSVTGYLGTVGDGPGVMIAAGTGVVTLAVGDATVARVDGWGNIMGDSGSAYWIGRAGFEAAMRAYDKRGPATLLLDAMQERYSRPADAYIELQNDPDRVRTVASFAASVDRLSEVDAVAAGICASAAEELAHSALTALTRVGQIGAEPAVGAIGGVFRSSYIHSRFEAAVLREAPDARLAAPRGTGLDGVSALAGLPPGHPLRPQVARAGAEAPVAVRSS